MRQGRNRALRPGTLAVVACLTCQLEVNVARVSRLVGDGDDMAVGDSYSGDNTVGDSYSGDDMVGDSNDGMPFGDPADGDAWAGDPFAPGDPGCVAEDDPTFCTGAAAECGSVTASDNCGVTRTADCGPCSGAEWCNQCQPCNSTNHCGPTCVQCTAETPDCAGTVDGCLCNATSCDPGRWCDAGTCASLDVGLVAHWLFDETSGTTAVDATGNGHDATLFGMNDPGDWVAGKYDNALSFDGAWSRVTMSSLDGASFPLNGTWSAWLKADWSTIVHPRPFWDEWTTDVGRNLMCLRQDDSGGGVRFFMLDNRTSATTNVCWGTIGMEDGVWQHLAMVWDSDNNLIRLYVDAVLRYTCDTTTESDGTTPIPPGWTPNGQEAIIGKDNATQTFLGVIDDLRLYDRVLPLEEIEALFAE